MILQKVSWYFHALSQKIFRPFPKEICRRVLAKSTFMTIFNPCFASAVIRRRFGIEGRRPRLKIVGAEVKYSK